VGCVEYVFVANGYDGATGSRLFIYECFFMKVVEVTQIKWETFAGFAGTGSSKSNSPTSPFKTEIVNHFTCVKAPRQ